MTYQTRQDIKFFFEVMGLITFFLFVVHFPYIIQTEIFVDQCGFGFINPTFGGFYWETVTSCQ